MNCRSPETLRQTRGTSSVFFLLAQHGTVSWIELAIQSSPLGQDSYTSVDAFRDNLSLNPYGR